MGRPICTGVGKRGGAVVLRLNRATGAAEERTTGLGAQVPTLGAECESWPCLWTKEHWLWAEHSGRLWNGR